MPDLPPNHFGVPNVLGSPPALPTSPSVAVPSAQPARERIAALQQLQAAMHQADDDTYSLNVALANAVEGIARMDFEGRYLWVNPAYCTISGWPPDELVGHRAEDVPGIVDESDRDKLRAAYLAMLRVGRTKVDLSGTRPDGDHYWKQVTLVPAIDRLGRFVGHFRFVHDITHRKKNEENVRALSRDLAERDRRFRMLVQSAPEAVVTVDRTGKIVTWNDEATRMFGVSAAEAAGKPLEMLMPDREHAVHARAFAAALVPGVPLVRRRRILGRACRRDGEEFPVEVTLSVWEEDQGRRMATAFIRELEPAAATTAPTTAPPYNTTGKE